METKLFDAIFDFNKHLTKIMPLSAIWLDNPIQMGDRKTARITAGDMIRIKGDKIENKNTASNATHEVLGCYGNIANTILYFDLKDLQTNELFTLKIK